MTQKITWVTSQSLFPVCQNQGMPTCHLVFCTYIKRTKSESNPVNDHLALKVKTQWTIGLQVVSQHSRRWSDPPWLTTTTPRSRASGAAYPHPRHLSPLHKPPVPLRVAPPSSSPFGCLVLPSPLCLSRRSHSPQTISPSYTKTLPISAPVPL